MSLQKRSKNCLYPLYSFTHQCVEPEIPVNARSEPSRMMPIGNFANESRVFIYSYAHVSCSRLSFRARVSRFALASCSRLVLASCSPHSRLMLASRAPFALAPRARVSFRARISRFALASRARFMLASRARFALASLIPCSRLVLAFLVSRSRLVLASHFVLASCSRFSFRARFMLASHFVVAWSLLQIC